ncbi:MAG: DUF6033 family protein [Clostridium sp.]|nr:DUF6033 family protein [Clostridium sp.]
MNLGMADIAYIANQCYVNSKTNSAEQKEGVSFNSVLAAKEAQGTELSKVDAYTEYLRARFGNVMISSVGKDQKSMDALGAQTFGTGNVVIAPNILREMANDPEKAAYYEKKIQEHFDSIPETKAFMASIGHRITSCGVVIHADGTVTYYLCGEETPEKKAKVEADNKAKREKKEKQQKASLEHLRKLREQQQLMIEKYNHEQFFKDTVTVYGSTFAEIFEKGFYNKK